MFQERRVDPREGLAIPLELAGGVRGLTRDISASGLFFVIDGWHALQGPVQFEMELAEIGIKFSATGEIVRIEHRDGRTGVAVSLATPRLDALEG